MTDQATSTADAARASRAPGRIATSILLALAPILLCQLAAFHLGSEVIALAGVPLSLLVAWRMLHLRGLYWSDVGFRRNNSWPRLLGIAFASTFLLLVLTSLMGQALASIGVQPDLSRFDRLRGNTAMLLGGLLVVWTTAAFGEELLMRGFLMHSLHDMFRARPDDRVAWVLALLGMASVFGLAHAYQGLAGVLMTGVIGAALGLLYFIARRDLWACILTHGLFDTSGFLAIYTSADKLLPEGATVMLF
jgi:uncharacterized protein